jgi:glutamate decarboxylase
MGLVSKASVEEIARRARRTRLPVGVAADDVVQAVSQRVASAATSEVARAVSQGMASAAAGDVAGAAGSARDAVTAGAAGLRGAVASGWRSLVSAGDADAPPVVDARAPRVGDADAPPVDDAGASRVGDPDAPPVDDAGASRLGMPGPDPQDPEAISKTDDGRGDHGPAVAGVAATAEDELHVPVFYLHQHGIDAETAYDMISSELLLDGSARLNLATFVTTSMPTFAAKLMAETADKNMIDKDEYPQTAEMEARCVNIISHLWHSPAGERAIGCSTTGSSEAVMLAALALKWRWRERMRKAGKPADRPNLVTGANVQVCWEKFCRYWDVEDRLVPLEGERLHLTPEVVARYCDENTIGVATVLGSTFDGSYEPIKQIAAELDRLHERTGLDVPMHVDAASGGFVAPFIEPDLEWDFRIPRVVSINASGHKYGLVYPGVGWAIWRNPEHLPEQLIFDVNYLGGHMPTFSLNFSRPGSEVVAQYYMFTTLGFEGYRRTQQRSSDIAQYLAAEIAKIGPYRLISRGDQLPVLAFALKEYVVNYTVFDVSDRMRERGWLIPAYTYPPHREDLAVLRIVVRAGMTHDMADLLLADLRRHTARLEALTGPLPASLESDEQIFAH